MPITINNYSNTILKNISFSLDAGKDLIILGSNGVGKTTLAKVLCGIIPSTAVTVENLNPSKIYGETRARLVNYIPPHLDIFDTFITVREFLELSTLHSELTIDQALERLRITHLADKSCKSLSSGESQLLLIASTLLHDARYTIFDEPTANLDPQKMQLLFTLLKSENSLKSKLIITHNLDLAYKLGYNILFLEEGAVKFYGTSQDFFTQEHLTLLYDGSVERQSNSIRVKL